MTNDKSNGTCAVINYIIHSHIILPSRGNVLSIYEIEMRCIRRRNIEIRLFFGKCINIFITKYANIVDERTKKNQIASCVDAMGEKLENICIHTHTHTEGEPGGSMIREWKKVNK